MPWPGRGSGFDALSFILLAVPQVQAMALEIRRLRVRPI